MIFKSMNGKNLTSIIKQELKILITQINIMKKKLKNIKAGKNNFLVFFIILFFSTNFLGNFNFLIGIEISPPPLHLCIVFFIIFCRSNPWPNECLPRMKSTLHQCGTHSWSCPGTFSDPHQEANLGPLGWQPSPLTTTLPETS